MTGPREFLLDVSRLVWRAWRGGLPTGIDRVCLEYVRQFGSRSQAVVQRKGAILVLSPEHSDRLFSLVLDERPRRSAFVALGLTAWLGASRSAPRSGMIYLNVGHTGLDNPALPAWIARNRARAVYLVHDLIPLTHPEFCRAGEAGKHAARMENALSSAAGIVGNSQATLDELATFAVEHEKPMPETLVAWISGHRPPANVRPRTLERPHFITLGTIEGRKNHLLLLRIWERLVAEMGEAAPILLIVGQRGWEAESAIAMLDRLSTANGPVRELGRCRDDELAALLAGARALLMPSFAEGFGLPVIEALQLGTPVIASDLPVFREIAGDIPIYLDPLDRPGWEQAIRDFSTDSRERLRQLKAMADYRAPDWPAHFERVEGWLAAL